MPLKVIAENGTLVVVDKPAGFTVEEIANSLKTQVSELEKLGEEQRYGLVHRLDKDTSGILIFAKTPSSLETLQKEFQERKVIKQYVCLVHGVLKQNSGTIHTLLARSPADRRKQRTYLLEGKKEGGREAISEWNVRERFQEYTLIDVFPKTGRKHQIRAHMASLGHPIAGDKLYSFKNQVASPNLTRQFLHAESITIQGQTFISPLPRDLQQALNDLVSRNSIPDTRY